MAQTMKNHIRKTFSINYFLQLIPNIAAIDRHSKSSRHYQVVIGILTAKCLLYLILFLLYIPGFVAQCLIDIKKEQDEVKEALGSEYTDYNLIMATTFGMPINSSYIRDQLQKVIDREGLPDVVFHSLRHTSVTYKLNEQKEEENKITIPEGVDPELLMKVLGNPEMAALLTSLAKTMKV